MQLLSLHDEETQERMIEDLMEEASALIEEGIEVTEELDDDDDRALEFAERASSIINKLNGSPISSTNVSPNKDDECVNIGEESGEEGGDVLMYKLNSGIFDEDSEEEHVCSEGGDEFELLNDGRDEEEEEVWELSNSSSSSPETSRDISSQCHFMVEDTSDTWTTVEMSVKNGIIRAHASDTKDVTHTHTSYMND